MKSNHRILVVDDDPRILQATVRVLSDAGYDVIEAKDGTECLQLIPLEKPDLVLLDVILPDLEGTEVCRKIKEDPEIEHPYVILLSGVRTSPDRQADGLDLGADGYIARPVTNRELLARVASILRIKHAEDALREEKQNAQRLVAELTAALGLIKKLEGIVSICMHCHRIRVKDDTWQQLEAYISEHSDAVLSHSICSECMEKHYPQLEGSDS